MPIIKSNTDLGNDYDSISNLCYTCGEPVFITKNGKGDLAVMSIEAYCINRREFAICTDFFRHFAGDFLPPCRDSLPPRQFS